MDHSRFEATLRTLADSAGRRDAVRSLGAVGLGLLAAAGLIARDNALDEAEAKKKKKKLKPKPGPQGPAGPAGPAGATGATGATGDLNAATITDEFQNAQLGPNLFDTATLNPRCPNVNSKVLGGGFDTGVGGALSSEVTVNAAFPTARDGNTPEGFQVEVTRTGVIVSGNILVTAFVRCTS